MSQSNELQPGPAGPGGSGLATLPPLWVGVNIAARRLGHRPGLAVLL